MTKRICDLCGKEIVGIKDKYSISIDNDCAGAKYFMAVADVCPDCANAIYHCIEAIKKPLDKSTES